jgi:hypothetical protein
VLALTFAGEIVWLCVFAFMWAEFFADAKLWFVPERVLHSRFGPSWKVGARLVMA